MIEVRNLLIRGNGKLQYRYFVPAADGAGNLSAHGGGWSIWRDVPNVDQGSAAADTAPHRFAPEGLEA